ncbi:sulfate transport system ATP-binding protein [Clostridium saccharoperbutylacetonicum]|uniref:ABC-type quaternary amine transporter n=2 Tax=Clostridium TaxID=1485 RepID=M1MFP4_9CLOT|nr:MULTISPECIES: ABC transporter ATP-binding protein [Clostridium]AGF56734.1 sulfate/thiosulfate import ATP-binding protein CysA [Clostridium saccharoperbutylacetonicum N1-4(HMT)]NRT62511.1 sulfate transport system ATP-binding protein [Clostridium saccharoperbutylacetonicum]NSB25858.1 sulfate transport system ATP-binding protein [Clostridium saccharoperbutylacetonicum]NSB45217.1 sulfate transport system ATP-binding protein [Clostridium saccharoperbutylacetonicum]
MYVELKNVNKTFADFKASDNVNFKIEQGKLIGLLGPSGSGKTTILRMIAGLETPDSGDIIINGEKVNDVEPGKRGIGFVFQSYALFRHMTVYDNVAFGLVIQKAKKDEIQKRVMELIELIGLKGLEKRYPGQLSGGQRQRVAFARALAPNPKLLLLDEPFAAIDAKVRKELRSWLRETISKLGITSIFVTHDQDEAVEVADEIIITNKGKIEQKGTPVEIYKNPKTPFVAQFIGESNLIEDYTKLKGFEDDVRETKAIVRPEFIQLAKNDSEILTPLAAEKGIVKGTAFRGSNIEVDVQIGEQLLSGYRSLEEEPLKIGEEVLVLIHRVYAFNDKNAKVIENKIKTQEMSVFI